MRQMQGVLWTKGVLLHPQHLQAQDRFLEDQIAFRLSALSYSPWGFSRLELDREALAGGALALSSAAGILPDGMLFDMPDADPLPEPRPLEEHWQPDQESLRVHLAVPERRPGGRNVSGGDRSTRYRAELVMLRDENTGLAERPVHVARKNARLLVEGEPLEGFSALPVARVVRDATGELRLDGSFVPAVLDIAASEHLMGVARRLVEVLAARSGGLAGMRRQQNRTLADFGVADVANFWLLYTVNSHLPLFRHIYETRRGHPADLYRAMLGLAGALTTLAGEAQPGGLPDYDHGDPSGCFHELEARIMELLETVVPANHVSLPLRLTQPSIHSASLDEDRWLECTAAFLAVAAEVKAEDLMRRVPQLVKVTSGDRIERLIRQALPGAGITHVATPPRALPVKLDYQYFAVDRSGEDWDAIRRSRSVAVHVPKDLPDPRLELVLILPSGGD